MNRTRRDTNSPRDHPRKTYTIIENGDGTADIYLDCRVFPITTEDGATDYDVRVSVIRGIDTEGWAMDALEEDIRRRYSAHMDTAEVIYL